MTSGLGGRWGPRPGILAGAGLIAAAAVLWLLLTRSVADRLVAGFVLLVVVLGALWTLRIRDRLSASPAGLRIGTLSGAVAIPWARVHRIQLVDRRRLGTSSSALEIDAELPGNPEALFVFGRFDLGTDPADVATVLRRIRTGG